MARTSNKSAESQLIDIHKRLEADAKKIFSILKENDSEEAKSYVKKQSPAVLESKAKYEVQKEKKEITKIVSLLKKIDSPTLKIVEKMVKLHIPKVAKKASKTETKSDDENDVADG